MLLIARACWGKRKLTLVAAVHAVQASAAQTFQAHSLISRPRRLWLLIGDQLAPLQSFRPTLAQ